MKKYKRKEEVTRGYCIGCDEQWTCQTSEASEQIHFCPNHSSRSQSYVGLNPPPPKIGGDKE